MCFKPYQNTALFSIVGAQTAIDSDADIGIGIAASDFSGKHFYRVQIVGVPNTDFPSCIAAFLHTFPQLLHCPFLSAAFVQRLQLTRIAGTPDNADTQDIGGCGKRQTDAPVLGKVRQ